jgi:hypothetical protein
MDKAEAIVKLWELKSGNLYAGMASTSSNRFTGSDPIVKRWELKSGQNYAGLSLARGGKSYAGVEFSGGRSGS